MVLTMANRAEHTQVDEQVTEQKIERRFSPERLPLLNDSLNQILMQPTLGLSEAEDLRSTLKAVSDGIQAIKDEAVIDRTLVGEIQGALIYVYSVVQDPPTCFPQMPSDEVLADFSDGLFNRLAHFMQNHPEADAFRLALHTHMTAVPPEKIEKIPSIDLERHLFAGLDRNGSQFSEDYVLTLRKDLNTTPLPEAEKQQENANTARRKLNWNKLIDTFTKPFEKLLNRLALRAQYQNHSHDNSENMLGGGSPTIGPASGPIPEPVAFGKAISESGKLPGGLYVRNVMGLDHEGNRIRLDTEFSPIPNNPSVLATRPLGEVCDYEFHVTVTGPDQVIELPCVRTHHVVAVGYQKLNNKDDYKTLEEIPNFWNKRVSDPNEQEAILQRSAYNTFRVTGLSSGTHVLRYRFVPHDQTSQGERQPVPAVLPGIQSHDPVTLHRESGDVGNFIQEKVDALSQFMNSREFGYTMDPEFHALCRLAGSRAPIVVEALGFGQCGLLSDYFFRRALASGLEALLINGETLMEDQHSLNANGAHSQALIYAESGTEIVVEVTQLARDWKFKKENKAAFNTAINLIRQEQDDKALYQGLAALKEEFRSGRRVVGSQPDLATHENWMRASSPQRIDTDTSNSYLLGKVEKHLTTTGRNLIQPHGNLAVARELFKELEYADFHESDIQNLWNMGFDPKKIPDMYGHITKVALAGLRDPNETDDDKLSFVRSILDKRLVEDQVHISFSNLMDILGTVDLSTLSRTHMNELISLAVESVADGAGDLRVWEFLDSLEMRSFEEPIRMNGSAHIRLKAVMRAVANMSDSPHFDEAVRFSRRVLNCLPPMDRAEALMYGLSDLYSRSQYITAREVIAAYAKHGGVLDAVSESGELEHGMSKAFLAVVFDQSEPREQHDHTRTIYLQRTLHGFRDMHEPLLEELGSVGFELDWIFAPEQILKPLEARFERAMNESGAFNNPFFYEDEGIVAPASYVIFRSFGENKSSRPSESRILYNSLLRIDSCIPQVKIKDTLRSIPIDLACEKKLTDLLENVSQSYGPTPRNSMTLFGGIAFKLDYFDMEALMLPSYRVQRQITEESPFLRYLPDTEEVRTGGGNDPWGKVWSRVEPRPDPYSINADDPEFSRPKIATAVRILNQHVEQWKLEEIGIGIYRMFSGADREENNDWIFDDEPYDHESALGKIISKTLERSKDSSLLTEFKYQLQQEYGEASSLLREMLENLTSHELSCLVPSIGQLIQQKCMNEFFKVSSTVQEGCNVVDAYLPYSRSNYYKMRFSKRQEWFFESEPSFGAYSNDSSNYRDALGQSNMRKTVVAGSGYENREYMPGDDIRYMDWGATARTGVPHVRTAERSDAKRGYAVVDLEWLQADYKSRMPHLLSSIRGTVRASNQISMGLYFRGALLESVSSEELKLLVSNPKHPKSLEIFQRVDRPTHSIHFGRLNSRTGYQVFPTRFDMKDLPEKDRLRKGDSLLVFGEKEPKFQQQIARVTRQRGMRVAWSRTPQKSKD